MDMGGLSSALYHSHNKGPPFHLFYLIIEFILFFFGGDVTYLTGMQIQ